MTCGPLLMATEIILALQAHPRLPQVILLAEPALVEMTLRSFALPWRIVRAGDGFTVVTRELPSE